jgi:hypothetical protein
MTVHVDIDCSAIYKSRYIRIHLVNDVCNYLSSEWRFGFKDISFCPKPNKIDIINERLIFDFSYTYKLN